MQEIDIIDSHTGGEPTRVVIAGGPWLDARTARDAVRELREQHDWLRRVVIEEPRGSDILVGALLIDTAMEGCAAGVVFFNNAGYLAMCGHGTIGVAVTLARLGRIQPGTATLDTPAGPVTIELHDDHAVSVANVECYRHRAGVVVQVPGFGEVRGDVAWGGNWFFLVEDHDLDIDPRNIPALQHFTTRLRAALDDSNVRGRDGAIIDHIELCGPPSAAGRADSRNFVLCPGNEYDRSPCGTGTSARLACLLADGRLNAGETWRQEGITGSVFEAHATVTDGGILPVIKGSAWITARATLCFEPGDPLTPAFTR